MLLTGNIYEELNKAFINALKKSEANRLNIHQEFAAFYNNDYESICSYLREATLNNPFSEETLKNIKFRHVNVIRKIISRITSGIFLKDPVVTLTKKDGSADEALNAIVSSIKFTQKIKEAFSKAVLFNIVEAHVVWDMNSGEMRIDILTPNNYIAETGADYLKKSKIAVRKAGADGEIYWSYWSENEHYILKNGEKIPPPSNKDMVNPYLHSAKAGYALPFAVLRIEEGDDYYGEPNWNIFLHQKNLDIRLTDLNETELKTLHQIYLGINTNFTNGESFKAGDFKQINNVKDDDKEPKIESITANVDYTSVRENIDWHNRLVLNSEGISAASSSTELKAESGAAKVIDELELYEKREEYKSTLYHFMIHLLNIIRVVWNYYNPAAPLDSEGTFDIRFADSRIFESTDEKKKRHDMAIQYGFKDEIDITMEELEISEEEAIKRIKERTNRKSRIENSD
ncbi:MAG: hypothetical protein K8I03_14645 [Ignavibacteria bacterium]|nr:hypothetical protein [Ignavibacteria bacterium]